MKGSRRTRVKEIVPRRSLTYWHKINCKRTTKILFIQDIIEKYS